MWTRTQGQHRCQTFRKSMQNHIPFSDFATRAPFYCYTYFYGQFLVKKIFSINKNWGWTKSTPEKCSFDYNLHFLTKKYFFFAKILSFMRFSQIQGPGGKIRDWYMISHDFPERLTPMPTPDPRSHRNGKFRG